MPASLDELRKAYPHLGFAVYALTPGGLVQFEIVAPGDQFFAYEGPTAAAAIAAAFPPERTTVEIIRDAMIPPPALPPDPVNVFD